MLKNEADLGPSPAGALGGTDGTDALTFDDDSYKCSTVGTGAPLTLRRRD